MCLSVCVRESETNSERVCVCVCVCVDTCVFVPAQHLCLQYMCQVLCSACSTVDVYVCVCMCVCSPKPWRSVERWLYFSCIQIWSTNGCASTLISCHSRWKFILYTRLDLPSASQSPSHTHTQTYHPQTDEWFPKLEVKGCGIRLCFWQVTAGFSGWLENVFSGIWMNCQMRLWEKRFHVEF